jgi:putative YphP/YqiW family bacilliredoxin
MMYDPDLVRPMRDELVRLGARELLTPAEVDAWVADKSAPGLLVINSICGCAAGMARPGVGIAMMSELRPTRLATVFAGQDKDATARARSHFAHLPPSSPSMALFKDGKLVDFLPRARIEGRSAQDVGRDLVAMFEKHCAPR